MDLVRDVGAELSVEVQGRTRLAFHVAVADAYAVGAREDIQITLDGIEQPYTVVPAPHGGRIWWLTVDAGQLDLSYRARVPAPVAPPDFDIADELLYQRPSRFCESDRMVGFAERLFRDLDGPSETLAAISSWVGTQLDYVSGSSGPTDGAVETLLAGRGVCRDFAHLAVALLRAKGLAARLVSVYAPGLDPMDFHAVAEVLIDGRWYVIDATLLAPRSSLVRIATGRDAADTAFLTNYDADIVLQSMTVSASVDGYLPFEDVMTLVQLQ